MPLWPQAGPRVRERPATCQRPEGAARIGATTRPVGGRHLVRTGAGRKEERRRPRALPWAAAAH
eukprot:9470193-Pyramimonas_sp.AAC.1